MMRFSTCLKLVAVSATLLMAACASKPAPAPEQSGPMTSAPTSNIVAGSAEDLRVNVGDTVHFAYDSYDVEESDKSLLQRQASWLSKYPSVRVTIEGHADERGTREYNLALAARRANAVKEYLVSVGVSSARVDTISYGKERPICSSSDEGCWAENRRGVTTVVSGANS